MKKKRMDLNRETAMRLWNKSFGKETKAIDFAGRGIAKGAYGDRNSEFGWNVDHILPVSQGGKTNDSNLIVTHIITNDEKADKFPCFTANKKKFEIIKVQNHYEIREVSTKSKADTKATSSEAINYFDSAAGVRLFKKLKSIQSKERFVGSVLIRINKLKDTTVIDFIEQLLDKENISFNFEKDYYKSEMRIIAKNYNLEAKSDCSELLDKCVLLNTYMSSYFLKMGFMEGYDIRYRIDHYNSKEDMYVKDRQLDLTEPCSNNTYQLFRAISTSFENKLLINNLVVFNTDASKTVEQSQNNSWVEYDMVYSKLSENLRKEINR